VHLKYLPSRAPILAILLAVCLCFSSCGSSNKDPISDEEVADTLVGFASAYANGEAQAYQAYWASSCSDLERSQSRTASQVLADLLGGDYSVQIDPELLEIDTANGQVSVPLEQPTGAITATARGVDYVPGLPFEVPLTLVREDGGVKVSSCVLFTNDDGGVEEEP
jgi:hypothetical protein